MVCLAGEKTTLRALLYGAVQDHGLEEVLDHLRMLCYDQTRYQSGNVAGDIDAIGGLLERATDRALKTDISYWN